jgi:hypothetical protein
MGLNDKDSDWLKDAPNLAAAGKKIPFTVPSGYFEELSDTLRSRMLTESLRFKNEDEFKIPPQYFEQLSSQIRSRIALEDLRQGSSSGGFTVPDHYFTELESRIHARTDHKTQRIVPLRRLINSWVTYASAACITMIIGLSIYMNSSSYRFDKQLSKVPDEEIINYLQVYSTAGDTPLIIEYLNQDEIEQMNSGISIDEIEQYINNTAL